MPTSAAASARPAATASASVDLPTPGAPVMPSSVRRPRRLSSADRAISSAVVSSITDAGDTRPACRTGIGLERVAVGGPARRHEGDEMALTVAVTGPTGEIGISAVDALEREPQIERILGMARRPFDPSTHGWTKTEYWQGDILDADAVTEFVS